MPITRSPRARMQLRIFLRLSATALRVGAFLVFTRSRAAFFAFCLARIADGETFLTSFFLSMLCLSTVAKASERTESKRHAYTAGAGHWPQSPHVSGGPGGRLLLPHHAGGGGRSFLMIRERLDAIEGRLQIKSASSRGACVTISVPLKKRSTNRRIQTEVNDSEALR